MENKNSVHQSCDVKARVCGRSFFVWGLAAALFSLPAMAETVVGGVKSPNPQEVQQTRNVTGQVLDENGEPMIGVSVLVKGTTVGAITDFDGNFKLNAPTGATELQLTYMGYKAQTVKITSGQMVVRMEPDNQLLDEVVVIGYGTIKKRDLTGAVSSVKSDLITLTPAANPMQALQGRVAGLDITKSSGQAGSGVSMQLRGYRSITASGNPLFIIDGMPGDYSTLNPNDIESIEVLKDASSTAVYGSSGANGVVLITTKKGEAGKLTVNFNTYVGFNGWSILPKMRSGDSYFNTVKLAQQEAGTYIDDASVLETAVYEAYKRGENIDWADALMQTGVTQNYSVSLSGGTEKTQAYFSLNYSDEEGQYTNDRYKLYSTNIRIDHKVNKWFAAGLNVQGSYAIRNRTYSKLYNALTASPYGRLYNEDGSLNPYPVEGDNKQVNLLLNQDRDAYVDDQKAFKLYFNPYVRLTPLKGLTIESRVNGSLSFSNDYDYRGYGSYQFYDALGTGALNADLEDQRANVSGSVANSHSYNYKWENVITYNFQIAHDHDFTFTGVTSYNHNQSDNMSASAQGITSNIYSWTNLGVATGTKTVGSGYSMSKGWGLMARLNYSYLGRYLFSASVRHDGSSRLADGHKWSTFPAVSAGWRISDEKFMQSTRGWLDNLKVRVGYGETGTAGIDAYASWSILSQSNFALAGETLTNYYYPQTVPNPELTWERSKSTNIGIDASFLKNRIELTMDYYITNTDGVIWKQDLPTTGGGYTASSYFQRNVNIAKTKNRGFEMTLTTRPIVTKDFNWTSTLTYSTNHEEITSLGDGTQDYVTNGSYALHIGSPIHSYYNYKLTGIWQYGEEADAAVFGREPGDLKVDIPGLVHDGEGQYHKTLIDENGQEVTTVYTAENPYTIGSDDYQIIGHNSPDWSLGFQNTFVWKDFDLSVYMYARFGQMINYSMLTAYDNTGKTNFPEYFNYWTSTNPSNDFPALNSERTLKEMQGYSAMGYVDGSFFKIKNITLGYTLPQQLCQKAGLQKLRVYGTITNPWIVAKSHLLKDYDPEMGGSLDYPLTKQLVFGLNLTF